MRGHVFWLHCRTIERADAFSFELGAICQSYDNRANNFPAVECTDYFYPVRNADYCSADERTDYFYPNSVAILLHCQL